MVNIIFPAKWTISMQDWIRPLAEWAYERLAQRAEPNPSEFVADLAKRYTEEFPGANAYRALARIGSQGLGVEGCTLLIYELPKTNKSPYEKTKRLMLKRQPLELSDLPPAGSGELRARIETVHDGHAALIRILNGEIAALKDRVAALETSSLC